MQAGWVFHHNANRWPLLAPPHPPQVDQLAAEVAQLRNANGASVAASEERLHALQAQYEDLLGWVEAGAAAASAAACGWGAQEGLCAAAQSTINPSVAAPIFSLLPGRPCLTVGPC
jgi:hypothetical protein